MKKKTSTKPKNEKNAKKQDKEKRDFFIALGIVIGIVLLVVATHYLPRLIDKLKENVVDFSQGDDYIEDEYGNKFYMLNRSVEAINVSTLHGKLSNSDFYLIQDGLENTDPPKFIVEMTDGVKGYVYRSEGEADIFLSDFVPDSADIYLPEAEKPHDYFYDDDEESKKCLNLLYNAIKDGEEVTLAWAIETSVRVKLRSDKYPGLYYTTVFCKDENGKAYLGDIGSGKYVLCPDELTVRFLGTEG